MNYEKKINNSDKPMMFAIISTAIAVSVILYISSLSIASSVELSTAHIQNVKHNSSHETNSNSLSQSVGIATIMLKTDIINDSDCSGSIFSSAGKPCINNKDMKFLVEVSDNSGSSGNLYKNTVYGSPNIINLQVTTSDDSTKSNPDKYRAKFDGPQYFGKGGSTFIPFIGPVPSGNYWFFNEPVSTASCEGNIWNGATITCNLVIHYAWNE